MSLRPLAWWDCGFESRWEQGYLSVVSVVCCRVEVSVTGWSLLQTSPTQCGVSECDHEASIMTTPCPSRDCCAKVNEKVTSSCHVFTAVSEVKIAASLQELDFVWLQNCKLIKNLCLVFHVCAGMKENTALLYITLLLLVSFRFKELIPIRLRYSSSLLLRL